MLTKLCRIRRVTQGAKVTVSEIATGDLYKQFGRISQAARGARHELGELPITYVLNRDDRAAAIVPAWAAEWLEAHADEMLAAMRADS
jgi:hypothetical protein